MIRNEPSSTLKLFCPAAGYLLIQIWKFSAAVQSENVVISLPKGSVNIYFHSRQMNVWISSTQHHTPAACWVLKSSVKKKYEKFWFELFHQMRSDLVWSLTPVFVTQLWTSCRPSTDKYVYPVADKYIQLHRQIYPVAHKYNQLHTNISN